MAKSIRSKIKRKHRAEFRATIGTKDYNEKMAKIQSKLKQCVEKGQLKSYDKLADMLDTTEPEEEVDDEQGLMAVGKGTTLEEEQLLQAKMAKGENKIPAKKLKKQKYKFHRNKTAAATTPSEKKERPKPRFFCQF